MFDSPEKALAALGRVGYFTDQKTATTVYLAGKLNFRLALLDTDTFGSAF